MEMMIVAIGVTKMIVIQFQEIVELESLNVVVGNVFQNDTDVINNKTVKRAKMKQIVITH